MVYLLTCILRPVVVSSVYRCNKWPVQNTFFFIPEVPAHLCLLWLKREKKRISQQVIHCSIVLLHTTPGSWDILDVLEL